MFAILVPLILIAVALWLVNQFIPMDPKFKMLINVVAIIIAVLYLLNAFGVNTGIHTPR
jgi:hypothetical protein